MKYPILLLALSYLVFIICVVATLGKLPVLMATHFDLTGHANGWMGRTSYLELTCGTVLGLPLFMVGVTLITGRLGRGLNIPNRDYWLAPERRAATVAVALRFVVVLAAIVVLLFSCLHLLVTSANADSAHPHLNAAVFITMFLGFLAAVLVWIALLRRRFALP